MRDLVRLVAQYGLELHGSYLGEDERGFYSPTEQRIYFDMRLTYCERRTTIAHELGHFHHNHDCSTRANERQADAYAARLLIDPHEYAALERINPDQHFLADELDVTVDIIFAYEEHCLTRVRGTTYARPKLGSGQWRYRAPV